MHMQNEWIGSPFVNFHLSPSGCYILSILFMLQALRPNICNNYSEGICTLHVMQQRLQMWQLLTELNTTF
jgi:hypothetical protein